MAEVTLKPDPQRYPVGTKVKFYPAPATGAKLEGQPPGELLEESTVASDGTLVVKGVAEGGTYVGWTSGNTYLHFTIPVAPTGEGLSQAAVEALIAEKAVSTASPTFTGTPTAPTPAEGDNSTKLATAKYADRAVGVEKSRAETAEALKVAKASNLSDLANAGTARTNLGLGTVATHALTDLLQVANNLSDLASAATARANLGVDAAGSAATAQAAAEAASGVRLKVHASVNTNGTTATADQLTPVDDSAESRPIKLPTELGAGHLIGIEKSSAEAHEVSVEGNMRGEAAQTIKLRLGKQTIFLVTDASGSWWPISMYIPLATLSTDYVMRSISIPAGQVPGNELLAEWEIHLFGTEKRTLVRARIRTSSGTIKVAITRGEAGTTEIAAYKALAGAETQEVVSSEQALSDKDKIRVTSSAGSSPKGLFLDIWEKVEK